MSDVAEGADAPQETTQEAGAGFDLNPLYERFDEMGPRMERIESQLSQFVQGQEPEEGADDEFDLASLFGDEQGQEAEPEPRNLNPEALQAYIAQQVQRGIQEAVNPLSESVQGLTMRHEAAELVSRYPDMDRPEVAGPVIKEADELANAMGRPELATNMKFLGTVYEAQMARRYAAGEVPVGGKQGFEAERGGGAGPVASDAPDAAQQMIAQAQKSQWWTKL